MNDAVVETEIAMDDGGARVGRCRIRQPGDEAVHVGDALCLGRSVLLAPALDLAGNIALRLAEVGKSGSREVEPMKPVQCVWFRI